MYGSKGLLTTMGRTANAGGMITEQVWDEQPLPERELVPGETTGSATPLAWAMAQYLRLAECIRQGRIVELPPEVARHFGTAAGA